MSEASHQFPEGVYTVLRRIEDAQGVPQDLEDWLTVCYVEGLVHNTDNPRDCLPTPDERAVYRELTRKGQAAFTYQKARNAKELVLDPGGFRLGGEHHDLSGRPFAMLKALLESRDHCATADDLRVAMDINNDSVDFPEQVVRDTAKKLRTVLRKAAGCSEKQNPLPSSGRGAELSYRISLP
jgi:hypothetical protein